MGDNAGKYQLIAQINEGYPYRISVGTCRGKAGGAQLVLVRQATPGVLGSAEERARLLANVRRLTQASHPHVAAIYDVDDDSFGVSFVGEYVEGEHLAAVLEAARTVRNGFPHRVLLRIVADLLAGLAYVHGLKSSTGQPLGLFHGGIHPGNVVVSYDGVAKIVGFESVGIRLDWRPEAPIDGPGASYAAPEQLSGAMVDQRADLFAVGLLVWEIIARQPLFKGGRDGMTRRLAEGPLPSIQSFVRGVPEALQAILDRALRTNPAERYLSADEMLRDVEAYLAASGRGIAPENVGERMRAVFAEQAEGARRCTLSWLQAASAGAAVENAAGGAASTLGPGGWLGSSMVRPPSLPPSAAPSLGIPVSPAATRADQEAASPASRSLMVIPSLDEIDQQLAPRRSRLVVGVFIGAALAFVAVGAVMAMGLVWRWAASPEPAAHVQAPSAPSTPPPGTPAAPAAPAATSAGVEAQPIDGSRRPAVAKSATVRLESEPDNAAVEWQGQVVGRTPIQLTVPLGIQNFAVTLAGYKRQDVAIDTSVAAGPQGFSTKVLLIAEEKAQRPAVNPGRRGGDVVRADAAAERGAAGTRGTTATTKSATAVSPPPAEAPRAPAADDQARPTPAAPPKIRAIDAKSPTIRAIDDNADGQKVRVIDHD